MPRVEYRTETIRIDAQAHRGKQIAERLNELAGDGWRAVALDPAPVNWAIPPAEASVEVLLEREAAA